MNWILLISIAIHLAALFWSVESMRRLRDWRLAFLSLMLALMVLRRGLALFQPESASKSQQWAEVPALVISVMSLLAVFFLGALLDELRRTRESVGRANEELGERERRLQAIIETEPECVKLLGPNCALLQMNPAGLRMIEADSLDQVVDRSVLDLVLPEYRPAFAELTERVLRGATETLVFEIRGLRGTRLWLETHATPYRDATGRITSLLGITRDITARKQAEAARFEALQFLENLVHSVDGIVWEADALTFQFSFVSQQVERILGYPVERWLTEPAFWRDHLHPQDRDAALDFCMNATSEGESHQFEYRMLSADGREVWLKDLVTVVLKEGVPARLRGIMVDITGYKRAEEALRASRSQLEQAQRIAGLGTWVSRPHLDDMLWWSDRTLEICGRSREEFDGSVRSFFEIVHPEDRPAVQEASRAACAGERPYEIEHRIVRPDGTIRWVHELAEIIRDSRGQTLQMIGVVRDVTARRAADEALRTSQAMLKLVLDSIPQGVFWKDIHSNYLGANRVSRRAMGVETPESVVGLTDFRVPSLSREQAEFYVRKDREVMDRDQAQFGIEETMTLPDGSTIWLETNKLPMHDLDGHVIGIMGTWQDITERKRADDELRASRERLQVLSRQLLNAQENERRHIARELHDQIGQSLTAIKLNLKSIQPSPDETTTGTILQETIVVVDQTLEQVRTLSLDLRPSMLDDLGLASALRWYLDRQARRAGFSVQFAAESSNGDVSKEIETTCFRVLQEIVTNIARHAHARNVRVELRRLDTELELFVQDDGVGFDLPAARERATRGSSLGLLGMQERVMIVGGRIDIQSAPSHGTEVRVRFPLIPTALDSEREKQEE